MRRNGVKRWFRFDYPQQSTEPVPKDNTSKEWFSFSHLNRSLYNRQLHFDDKNFQQMFPVLLRVRLRQSLNLRTKKQVQLKFLGFNDHKHEKCHLCQILTSNIFTLRPFNTNNFTLRPVFGNNFSRVRTIAVESFQLDGVTQVGEKIVLK